MQADVFAGQQLRVIFTRSSWNTSNWLRKGTWHGGLPEVLVDTQLGVAQALAEVVDRGASVIAAVIRDGSEDLQRSFAILIDHLVARISWQWFVVLQPLDVCVLVAGDSAGQSQSGTLRHGTIVQISMEHWLRLGNCTKDATAGTMKISIAIDISMLLRELPWH